jgi:DNA-binding transcriptional ArsR family regulator
MEPENGIEWFEKHADEAVIKALAHPIRLAICVEAARRPVSAKDMAADMAEPLPKVSYHVRVLADAGLLKPVRRTRRRGAIETHYRAVATIEISNETLERLGPDLRAALAEAMLLGFAQDLSAAVRSGAHEEDDHVLGRHHFRVDAEGRRRVHGLVRDFYDELAALEAEYDRNPPPPGTEIHDVSVAVAFFKGRYYQPTTGALDEAADGTA